VMMMMIYVTYVYIFIPIQSWCWPDRVERCRLKQPNIPGQRSRKCTQDEAVWWSLVLRSSS
jgi:hypothetical protein